MTDDAKRKADIAIDILDGMADQWAIETELTAIIKNVVSPMKLNSRATKSGARMLYA